MQQNLRASFTRIIKNQHAQKAELLGIPVRRDILEH